jgi:hypothetical protein
MNLRGALEIGWEKTPVLKVLDDLCARLGKGRPSPPALRSRLSDGSFHEPDAGDESASPEQIALDGEAKPLAATAHWNQFRAAVGDVVVTEHRTLKESRTQASLQLKVAAQPGTLPVCVGYWEVQEIVDDRGASLMEKEAVRGRFGEDAVPAVGESPDAVWFTSGRWARSGDGYHENVTLQPPSPGARRIARLKVSLRATFAFQEVTRTLALSDLRAQGKGRLDFGVAGIAITGAEHKNGSFGLDYELQGTYGSTPNFVLLDKEGSEINSNGGGSSSSGAKHHQNWTLRGAPEVSAVRASAWIGQKTIEIPFEFTDVPLPGEK